MIHHHPKTVVEPPFDVLIGIAVFGESTVSRWFIGGPCRDRTCDHL